VRSYRTVSPLPRSCEPFGEQLRGGLLSVALSRPLATHAGSTRRYRGWELPTTAPCEARTFLPHLRGGDHPASRRTEPSFYGTLKLSGKFAGNGLSADWQFEAEAGAGAAVGGAVGDGAAVELSPLLGE